MSGSFPRASRRFTVGLACLMAVTACSGDGDSGDPSSPEPTATVADNAPSQAEEQVRTVFDEFWNAVVEVQSSPSDDPAALFSGLAIDETIEFYAGLARRYERQGLIRVGEPVISDVTVQVVSDSGVVSACVDESNWPAEVNGELVSLPEEQLEPHPIVYEVVNSNGSWLIGEAIEPGGTITC